MWRAEATPASKETDGKHVIEPEVSPALSKHVRSKESALRTHVRQPTSPQASQKGSAANSADSSRSKRSDTARHAKVARLRRPRPHDTESMLDAAHIIRHQPQKEPVSFGEITGYCPAPHLHADGARTNRARLVSTVVTRRDDAFWPARRG